VEEQVDPMTEIQMTPHWVWRVMFEASDWSDPVMIQIQVGSTTYRRRVMKRQSLHLLEERLCDMPERDENTLWFRPDKVKIDAEIALYECQEEEILTIIQKEDGMIPVEMSFRHTTRRVTTSIPQAARATKEWVSLVWDVPRNILRTHISIDSDNVLQVNVLELEHSTEQYDDVPPAYVWVRIGENRRRQYRAQRATDAIQ
jgi:hypothetical protein